MVNRPYQYSFKRDVKGNLSDKGTYSSPNLTKTSFKFPKIMYVISIAQCRDKADWISSFKDISNCIHFGRFSISLAK